MRPGLGMLGSVLIATSGSYFTCVATTAPGASQATIVGVVVRGPTITACNFGAACTDVPFSMGFTVRQGDRQVGRFRSDEFGRFSVTVPVGQVTIVADPEAPILSPEKQEKRLEVPSKGRSGVVLSFDTGIR